MNSSKSDKHSRIVIHVDGSNVITPKSNVEGIGWAVIACHNDQLIETNGGVIHSRRGPLTGWHEQVAFIEGVLYAKNNGFNFKHLTILCDDDLFGYAQSWLHMDNFNQRRAQAVNERLERVAALLYPATSSDVIKLVHHAFKHATIHKLKGHSQMVYQERADYLAKFGARKVCGLEKNLPLSFEDWLIAGIPYFDREEKCSKTWYAPFVMEP